MAMSSLGRGNLPPQGRLLDGCGSHVGAQRDMRRDQGKTRLFRLRLQRLHGPPVQAEDVRHVRDADLRRIETEIQDRWRWGRAKGPPLSSGGVAVKPPATLG